MRINFERSGGFAGLPGSKQSLDFDTSAVSDELPAAKARELERLVEGAHFFDQPSKTSPTAANPVRDGYQYDLRLEDGERSHAFTLHDGAIAADVEPLIDWLNKELAAKLKREKSAREPPPGK